MLFHHKKILFGNGIDPSCRYCSLCLAENPDGTFTCKRDPKRPKPDDGTCRSFHYDPLMRKPRTDEKLPTYDASDFKL